MKQELKNHWEAIYQQKSPEEVSWTQEVPETSLNFIRSFDLPSMARIIDIGGGESKLVDHLLSEGYENVTVLDISSAAIERAKKRLGKQADKVTWIVSDITEYQPETTYDLWLDRATFHFLTSPEDINRYVSTVQNAVSLYMVIGTFSDKGPEKCSGLPVQQYTEKTLEQAFASGFEKQDCRREDHVTPFNTKQNFVFCGFKTKPIKQ